VVLAPESTAPPVRMRMRQSPRGCGYPTARLICAMTLDHGLYISCPDMDSSSNVRGGNEQDRLLRG